jgi:hypothetical protein
LFIAVFNVSGTNSLNAALDAAYSYSYQYDLVGNRLHEDRGLLNLDGTFNPLNQITALKYAGKLDIVGQVSGTNGNLAESYTYDALDRRISIFDGSTTNYLIYYWNLYC